MIVINVFGEEAGSEIEEKESDTNAEIKKLEEFYDRMRQLQLQLVEVEIGK